VLVAFVLAAGQPADTAWARPDSSSLQQLLSPGGVGRHIKSTFQCRENYIEPANDTVRYANVDGDSNCVVVGSAMQALFMAPMQTMSSNQSNPPHVFDIVQEVTYSGGSKAVHDAGWMLRSGAATASSQHVALERYAWFKEYGRISLSASRSISNVGNTLLSVRIRLDRPSACRVSPAPPHWCGIPSDPITWWVEWGIGPDVDFDGSGGAYYGRDGTPFVIPVTGWGLPHIDEVRHGMYSASPFTGDDVNVYFPYHAYIRAPLTNDLDSQWVDQSSNISWPTFYYRWGSNSLEESNIDLYRCTDNNGNTTAKFGPCNFNSSFRESQSGDFHWGACIGNPIRSHCYAATWTTGPHVAIWSYIDSNAVEGDLAYMKQNTNVNPDLIAQLNGLGCFNTMLRWFEGYPDFIRHDPANPNYNNPQDVGYALAAMVREGDPDPPQDLDLEDPEEWQGNTFNRLYRQLNVFQVAKNPSTGAIRVKTRFAEAGTTHYPCGVGKAFAEQLGLPFLMPAMKDGGVPDGAYFTPNGVSSVLQTRVGPEAFRMMWTLRACLRVTNANGEVECGGRDSLIANGASLLVGMKLTPWIWSVIRLDRNTLQLSPLPQDLVTSGLASSFPTHVVYINGQKAGTQPGWQEPAADFATRDDMFRIDMGDIP
jgi:hypothetical protein